MLYYLFEFFENNYNIPGAGVFYYISFRAALAIITSLLVSLVFGGHIIKIIKNYQIGEEVRKLGLEGEDKKSGTPTMGGLIILSAIIIPTLLFAKLENIYIQVMLISTLWLGVIGFVDDYIKVFKKDKKGLAGKFKILGQVGLGLIVGLIMVFHSCLSSCVFISSQEPPKSRPDLHSELHDRRFRLKNHLLIQLFTHTRLLDIHQEICWGVQLVC